MQHSSSSSSAASRINAPDGADAVLSQSTTSTPSLPVQADTGGSIQPSAGFTSAPPASAAAGAVPAADGADRTIPDVAEVKLNPYDPVEPSSLLVSRSSGLIENVDLDRAFHALETVVC